MAESGRSPQEPGAYDEPQFGSVTTTGATPTNISNAAVFVADGKEATVMADLIAKTGTSTKGFQLWAHSKRLAGGSAALVGTALAVLTAQGDAGLATATATLVATGNTVAVQVTGIAATTIVWSARTTVWRT